MAKKKVFRGETKRDKELQKRIRERADYSMAILGKAFIRHGSGRFLDIRIKEEEPARAR